MQTETASVWQNLVDIFVDPRAALTDIDRSRPSSFWVPMLIFMGVNILVMGWYYSAVDLSWLNDYFLNLRSTAMTTEQKAQAAKFLTRGYYLGITVVFSIVGPALIYLVQAFYLYVVGRVAGDKDRGFGKWFAFTAWTYFPGTLAVLASGVAFAFSRGNQVSPMAIDVASLNNLLAHLPQTNKWATLLQSLHLTTFWTLGLITAGLVLWTGRSVGKSLGIAVAPYIVIYGIWTLIKAL